MDALLQSIALKFLETWHLKDSVDLGMLMIMWLAYNKTNKRITEEREARAEESRRHNEKLGSIESKISEINGLMQRKSNSRRK